MENLIRESAPRTLYHGTLKEYLPTIKTLGLEPMVGDFVSNFYDPSHEEGYEAERDALDPLVFAATKKDLQRCVNAIVHRLRDKRIPATSDNIIAHGAIVVTRDTNDQFYHREREETRYEDHPTQVEPGDFYSYETIHPDYVLTGKKLRDLLRRNKVDGFVSMRPPIRSVTEGLDDGFEAVLYHGTTEHFTEFDFDKIKSGGPFGRGIYMSNDLGLGRIYSNGGDPMVVRVKLKKPYRVDLDDYWAAVDQKKPFRSSEGRQQLLDDGYDGVVVTEGRYVEVVAYRGADLEIITKKDQISESSDMVLPYGYWLTETGEFISVYRDGGHYPIVIDRLDAHAPNEFITAMKSGWIRIAGIEEEDEIGIDTYGKYTGPRAIKALMRFLKQHPFQRYYHVDELKSVNMCFTTLTDLSHSISKCTDGSNQQG